jgi:hypothetical protein
MGYSYKKIATELTNSNKLIINNFTAMKKLLFLAVVVLGFTAFSHAQSAASAGAFARIEVPSTSGGGGSVNVPQSIGWTADMNFGTITNTLAAGTTGTITLSPVGGISIPTGTALAHGTMTGAPAEFLIKGATPGQINITYPATLQLTGDGVPLTLTLTPNVLTTPACWVDVPGSTDKKLKIGGTLAIPAGAWGGYSSGSNLTVTVTHF